MDDHPMLGFADGVMDRAALHRIDPAWLAERLQDPATRFIRFHGDLPAIDVADGNIRVARFEQAAGTSDPVLLGVDGNGDVLFATQLPPAEADSNPANPHKLVDLRSLAIQGTLPAGELGLLAQARSLLHWHARHGFCAVCGAATVMAEGGYRRHCEACGASHFPRTDPVVIMVALRGDRCLLGRSPHFVKGMYSALAGFMEPGETIEHAARREIYEEAGIRIGNVDYIVSQPWPFPASLMIGLVCEALDDTITIDPNELEDARWFGKDELDAMRRDEHPDGLKTPPSMAIAYHIVMNALGRM